MAFMAIYCMIDTVKHVNAAGNDPLYLSGIGYREQALQVAKTSFFKSEEAHGVHYASFGGGTMTFIKGVGLIDNPNSNKVLMFSKELNINIQAPALTDEDEFMS
jgi:hypothetical protein